MQKDAIAGLSGGWAREHCFPLDNILMFLGNIGLFVKILFK